MNSLNAPCHLVYDRCDKHFYAQELIKRSPTTSSHSKRYQSTQIMMLRCEKCKIKNVYLEMRQCDYPLCNNCEKKRREEIKEIEKGRNSSSSPSEVSNLARLLAPLTTSSTKSDKTKLNPQKTETPKSHEATTNFVLIQPLLLRCAVQVQPVMCLMTLAKSVHASALFAKWNII